MPLGVKKYLDKIRNDATEAYEEGDIERLVDIQVELLGEKSSCENVQKDFDKPYENEYYEESTTSEEEDNSTFSLVSFLNYLSLKLLIKEIKAEFYGS